MNGVTGRMGLNQHLVRSILAIREQGGVALPDGGRLFGRNRIRIELNPATTRSRITASAAENPRLRFWNARR